MATVYLRGRIWWARWYRLDGSRTQQTTGSQHKREAQRIAAQLEATDRSAPDSSPAFQRILQRAAEDARAGRLDASRAAQHLLDIRRAADPAFRVVSLRDHFAAWCAAQDRRVSASTSRTYQNARRHFERVLPADALRAPVGELTPATVEKALHRLAVSPHRGRTLRAATVNQCLHVLRRVLQDAVNAGHATANPAGSIAPLPENDSTERAPFTVSEVRAMLDHPATSPEWRGCILIAAHTGLRLSDVVSLTSSHLDGSTLVLRPAKTARLRRTLRIPLTPPCLAWSQDRAGPWFPTLRTSKPGTLSTRFRRIMSAAGVPRALELPGGIHATRSFHSLRHSFVSWLAESDIHADVRQRLAGHSSAGIHAIYTHHDDALARAIGTLPALRVE